MRTDHVFPHVREDAKGKRLRLQTKEVVANVYDYFEEIHRYQRTQGPHVPGSTGYRDRKLTLFTVAL